MKYYNEEINKGSILEPHIRTLKQTLNHGLILKKYIK